MADTARRRGTTDDPAAQAFVVVGPDVDEGKRVAIEAGALRIGRGAACEVRIDAASLSEVHAQVTREAGRYVLTDLNSESGTYVAGRRIRRAALDHGARFRCGDQAFAFLVERVGPELLLESEVIDQDVSASELARKWQSDWAASSEHASATETLERRLLLKTAEWLSLPQPIHAILERVLDLIVETLDADRGVVLLADEQTGRLEPRTARGRNGEANPSSAFSGRIVQHVYEKGTAALFSDPWHDPRIDGSESVRRHAISSSMCAPLLANRKVLGVVYVDCRGARSPLGRRELDVLSAMASQAAVAIENWKLREQLEREAVYRSHLARFFPPAIVARMLDRPETLSETREVEITALFCDVTSFTAMVERMPPLEVAALLNAYLPAMVDVVFAREGTLEKYIGDALLAVWGAPLQRPDDAQRAVEAACEMQRAVARLIARRAVPPDFSVHIGIASGIAAAGNIGSESYLQYATVGSATNLAARICEAVPGAGIGICERTHARIANSGLTCTPRPATELKGLRGPRLIYDVH